MNQEHKILYCRCSHYQRLPKTVSDAVLAALSESGASFEAVSDLCCLTGRSNASLKALAKTKSVRIAACNKRVVEGLFASMNAPLADDAIIADMKSASATEVIDMLLGGGK